MAAKKDKMIPSEKERKRALKYATPAGTGRMWVAMGINEVASFYKLNKSYIDDLKNWLKGNENNAR